MIQQPPNPDLRDIVSPNAPAGVLPQGGYNIANAPSLTDRLGGVAGGLVQAALHQLRLPLETVQTIAGGGNRENWEEAKREWARKGAASNDPISQWISDRTGVSREDVALGVGGQILDIGMDPLTYVGGGIPRRLLQLIPQGSRLQAIAPALRALDTGETLTQQYINTLFLGLARGVNVSGKGFPAAVAPHMDALGQKINLPGMPQGHLPGAVDALRVRGTGLNLPVWETRRVTPPGVGIEEERVVERPAENFYDLITSVSRESQFKVRGRALWDYIDQLTRRGYNVGRAVTDEDNLKAGELVFQLDPTKYRTGRAALEGMESNLNDKMKEAPNGLARAGLVEVMRQVEVMNAAAWEQARIAAKDQMAAGPTGKLAGDVWRTMYKSAMDRIAINYRAAADTADDLFMAASRTRMDPILDRALGDAAVTAFGGIQRARKIMAAPGMFPVDNSRGVGPKAGDRMRVRIEQQILENQEIERVANGLQNYAWSVAPDDVARVVDTQEVLGRMMSRTDELSYMLRNLPGEAALVEDVAQGPLRDVHNSLIRNAAKAMRGRHDYHDALEHVWNKYMPGIQFPKFKATPWTTAEESLEWTNNIVNQLDQVIPISSPHGPIANQVDLFKWLRQYADSEVTAKLQRRIDEFPGVDLITGNPFVAAGDRATRQLASQYGIKSERTIRGTMLDSFKTANSFFREQALTSFSYPLVNAMGALLNSSISGVAPMTQFRTMVRSVGETLRDPEAYYLPSHIQNFVTATGINPTGAARGFASGIIEANAQATRDMTGAGQPVWQKIGRVPLAAGGGLAGAAAGNAVTPGDATDAERNANIAAGAGIGAGWLGVAYPAMNKFLVHRLAKGVEDAARGEVWFMGAAQAHQQSKDAYRQIIQNAIGSPRGRQIQITGRDAAGLPVEAVNPVAGLPQSATDNILKLAEARDYMLSPEALGSLLRREGVQNEAAQTAVRQWRDLNARVGRVGESLAAEVQFDYQNLNNLEQFMREFTPFSTWAFKALPFWAKHLTEKPVIGLTLSKYIQETEATRQDRGLTSRFAGSTRDPVGFGSWFWSQMLGYPVMAHFNPWKSLIPFAESTRNVNPTPDETPLETVNRLMGVLGLPQMAAPIQTAARLAGAMGDAPAQGLLPLRAASPIQGITSALGMNRGRGIDLNAGQVDIERRIREGLGQEVAEPGVTQAMSRIDEKFLRETGRPISSADPAALPYIEAKYKQTGPVWDEAQAAVAREKGLRGISGFIFGPATPQALLTPEEEAIRYVRAHTTVLNQQFSKRIQDEAIKAPTAPADPEVVQTMRDASAYVMQQLRGDPTLTPGTEAVLQSGTNRDMNRLRKEIFEVQRQLAPLASGYGQSGGADEARLQAGMALSSAIPGKYPGGPDVAAIQAARPDPNLAVSRATLGANLRVPAPLQPTANAIRTEREAMRATDPLLAQYFAWKDQNPDAGIDDFLRWYRRSR